MTMTLPYRGAHRWDLLNFLQGHSMGKYARTGRNNALSETLALYVEIMVVNEGQAEWEALPMPLLGLMVVKG